jgi:uncharacterized phage protein (TIGR02218 family)
MTGFTPSATQTSGKFDVDNLEVQGVLSSSIIREVDLIAGVWDYAKVSVFEVNYMDLSMGINPIRNGYLGQVSTIRNKFSAEIRGLLQYFQQPVGRSLTYICDANFCDARCGLSKASWTSSGVINSLTGGRTINATLANPSWSFIGGLLTMTSGPANGFSMEIRSYTSPNTLVLQELFPYSPMVGDTFAILAGCDKFRATCKAYNNIINFRGFADLPGMDKVFSGT